MEQKPIQDDASGDEAPVTLIGWIRALRPRHVAAAGSVVALLLLMDEVSGITPPFERLRYFIERGLVPTVIYSVVAVALSLASLLLLRSRLRWLSLSILALLVAGTLVELSFNVFTGTGFSEDWVAISMRELGMAPEAMKAYVDRRVLTLVGIGIALWLGIWAVLQSETLFGPRLPGRATLLVLAGLMAFGGVWRLRFDHFRAYPLYLRPAYNVVDYYAQQQLLPDRVRPDVARVTRADVARRIVFIVDESIRPDYLGFQGFTGATTPYLSTISNRLYDFGTAVSGSTCSDTSNKMLNSFVRPGDVEDRIAIETRPTIFHFAKRAGYRTVLLSAVYKSPLFYGIRRSDLADIDETIMINLRHEGPKYLNDHHLVKELASLFDGDPEEKLFVYVRKQGTHFPFDDYYPPTEQHFLPVLDDLRPMHEHRAELLNSYLNGLRWNLDRFYQELDTTLGDREAVYLYTSDHGEDVELAGGGLLHCAEYRTMAMVPLWIDVRGGETRDRFEATFGTDFAEQNRDRASHMNIFPTLLSLMNVDTDAPTLFDDLRSQMREYYPPGYRGTYRTQPFDSIP